MQVLMGSKYFPSENYTIYVRNYEIRKLDLLLLLDKLFSLLQGMGGAKTINETNYFIRIQKLSF